MVRYTLLLCIFCSSLLPCTAQNVFTITNGATLGLSNGAVITCKDIDFMNNGFISQPGNGKIVFSGIQNSVISGSGSRVFDTLETIKVNGAAVVLQRDIDISAAVRFGSGLIDLNNHIILLQPGAVLKDETDASHITGPAGGFVQVSADLNIPASANPGNLGVIITSPKDLGITVIQRGHQSQTSGSGSGASIERYYTITPTNNTNLDAVLRMEYFDAELNGRTEELLTLWKGNGSGQWQDKGFTTRNASLNYVGLNNVQDFSRWTLSDVNGALPVVLLYFKAVCLSNTVQLAWQTANEAGIDHYLIERSNNGINWAPVKAVDSRGNSVGGQLYTAVDDSGLPGAPLYRLKIVEKDGTISYSAVAKSNCQAAGYITAMPNPVTSSLQVTVASIQATAGSIKLYNTQGQLLRDEQIHLVPGANYVSVNVTAFPAGLYQLVVSSAAGLSQSIKIIKK